jgi:hypothetical protein
LEVSEWFDYERVFTDSPIQKRAFFTQLKHAAERRSNQFDFLKFKASEMKAQKEFEDKKQWTAKNLNEKFIFIAGLTNDFGLNWIRPLGLLVGFNLIFFLILFFAGHPGIILSPANNCEEMSNTFRCLTEASPNFFRLFNPADFKMVDNDMRHSFIITGILLLQKITLGFFIFQIISAFRKYVK